jgi:2-oxo-3-hexenedioate decarboxylase
MSELNLENLALQLDQARLMAKPVEQLSKYHKNLTRADAYTIQEKQLSMRLSRKEKLVGLKMGLTSEAKRQQMNLDSPLYGVLTDAMQIKNGGFFPLKGKIHPKIEPEIAFKTARELKWPVTRNQVLEACSGVAACLEILDSRYTEFKYFSMEDVIADNSSSSHFIVGTWITDLKKMDLISLKMDMYIDDKLAHTGNSKDISGDPVMSVVDLCKMLAERGKTLAAGSIVLAGAATPAVALKENMKVKLLVEGFSAINVSIE